MKITVKDITFVGMLVSIAIVMKIFIKVETAYFRFSFTAVPLFIVGYYKGPVLGLMAGYCTDFIYCIYTGRDIVPNFMTLSTMMCGFIAGIYILIFKKYSLKLCVLTVITSSLVSFGLNSIQLYVIYGMRVEDIYIRIISLFLVTPISILVLHELSKRVLSENYLDNT